ncbi:hypothetical protein C8T65DRAFT_286186 [Cerioporus squamosus]|nr:hypothetical protein C8T65DRAFT_286186 [Cerioporus squamosus]
MAQNPLVLCGTPPVNPRGGPTIHRLPDEILVYIFIHFSDSVARDRRPHEYDHQPPRRHACHWMPLMLVCRRWREIGLAYPTLWQAIDVESNLQWLKLALDRSRGATIELRFHSLPTALSSKSISLLTQLTHRMRKLLLPPVKPADVPALQALLSMDMPVLKELGVYAEKYERGTAPATSFCSAHFPNLRLLRLSYMGFPWEPSAVSRLQYLHLYECHSLDPTLPFERFLDVLAGCPELEELRLHRFISTISHHVPAGFEREVCLPRIRKLVVGDAPSLIGLFLSSVSLPARTTLRLTGWIDSPVGNALRLMTSMLPKDRGKLAVLRSATNIQFNGYGWLDIQATSPHSSITLRLRSSFDPDDLETYTTRALEEFAHIFESASVEKLLITCAADSVDDIAVWEDLFASFPGLRFLHVLPGQTIRPIWHALSGRSFPIHENVRNLLCPKLRALTMEYLWWDNDAMDYVMASLRRRAMRGLPKLQSLELMFYTGDEEEKDKEVAFMLPFYVDHLKTYTASFEWGLL